MKVSKLFTILIIALFAAASAVKADDRYNNLLDRADKAIGNQEWHQAEQLLIEAMRSDPSNPANVMLLSNVGMMQFYQGNDVQAVNTLSDAHTMAPSSIVVLSNRARVLTALGDVEHALADYDLINRLDSTAWQPYHYRGLIYLTMNDTINAAVNINRLERLYPNMLETKLAVSMLLMAQERLVEAIPYLDALIAAQPSAELYAARALCNIAREYYSDASIDIADGLALDPDLYKLYEARALLNRRLYRSDSSLQDAQRAIDLGADPARIKYLLGL